MAPELRRVRLVSEPARFDDYGEITSVVVSQGGEVVIEEYLDGDVSTLRNTRSCTKTVVGMLLGMAIDRGIVPGVETPLQELLGEPAPPVMLRDLLTMSSCLDCNDWDDGSPGNEELMYPQEDWLSFALRLPLRRSRGFSYCTAGVVALGVALERALGEPLSNFAERELFTPLGIEGAQWVYTPKGETSAAGGLELTSRSLLRLGELYLGGGEDLIPANVGRRVDPPTRAHRRRAGVRLPVVAPRVRRRVLLLHDRHGREPGARAPRERARRRDHDHELRPSRRARFERPAAQRTDPRYWISDRRPSAVSENIAGRPREREAQTSSLHVVLRYARTLRM